jgi:hypothetical protein
MRSVPGNPYNVTSNNDTCIPTGQTDYQPLGKMKPVFNSSTTIFQCVWTPEENLTHVYMKGKPHRCGSKIYQLCEAKNDFLCKVGV